MSLSKRAKDFAYWRAMRVFKGIRMRYRGAKAAKRFAPTDERVRYPSYKSLDELLDVERLRAMDASVTQKVLDCLGDGAGIAFNTGPLKDPLKSIYPGSTVLELTSANRPFKYFDLTQPEIWKPTPLAETFSEVMDFARSLPFEITTRIIVMADAKGRAVTMHRDHGNVDDLHDFVWFRTNLKKPFFVADPTRTERAYLRSYTAWFDTVNQYHGADAADGLTISMRVDGTFTEAFRAQIPQPACNPACTPSLWATLAGEAGPQPAS